MKRKIVGSILVPLLSFTILSAAAEASPITKPWPTHAPEATPYVRVFEDSAVQEGQAEPVEFESIEDMWSHFHEKHGRLYARREELEMFHNHPQNEA